MAKDMATPVDRRSDLTLPLCFFAALAEGFDLQSAGVAAPTMAPALHLSHAQLGPVFSASVVGLLIGAVLFGRLADRVGRKRVLIASLTVFGVFSLATAWAGGFESLLTIRILAGIGLGGAMPNLIALSAEASPLHRRARLVTFVTAGMPFGGAVAGAIAVNTAWRGIFVFGGIAPLILAVLMAIMMRESEKFLAARGSLPAPGQTRRIDYRSVLFGGGRAGTTALLWAASFASLLSLYLMVNWLPTLMGVKGVSKLDGSFVSLLFNVGGGLGVLALAALLDQPRKRLITMAWYCGLAASLIGLALAKADLLSSGAAGFAAGVFVASAPIALYGLAPGFYSVIMRGTGVGASVAVGRLGAIVGPLMAAALLGGGFGASGVLLGLLPMVAIAAAATLGLLSRGDTAD